MIKIDVTPRVGKVSEPKRMIMASQQKIGKTRLLMQLPKSFIVDMEDSLEHFTGGAGFNVIREQAGLAHTKRVPVMIPGTSDQDTKDGKPLFKTVKLSKTELVLEAIPEAIKALNAANGGVPVFDFGILDTLTAIEELARGLATKNYKGSLVGKRFKGKDVVSELGEGVGYDWHRKAVEQILNAYEGLFGKCLILSAHIKDTSIGKKDESIVLGQELMATGKLRKILPAKWDATGYLYRKELNVNYLSFVTTENDKATGARNAHISGKDFMISKLDPNTDTLETFWEIVFPSIKPF